MTLKYAIGICALSGLTALNSSAVSSLDLTSTSATTSGEINGAWFYSFTGGGAAGTGTFDTFVSLQAQGNNTSEQGYNASVRPVMPDVINSSQVTRDIRLSDVPLVGLPDGNQYYEFALDINQQNNNPLLSLDALRIYLTPNPLTEANDLTDLPFTPFYDLDAAGDSEVLLNYDLAGTGGGRADLLFYFPVPLLPTPPTQVYVYLYSQFGAKGGDYAANDGPEEWGVRTGATRVPDGGATVTFLGLSLLGLAWVRRNLG